MFLGLQCSYIVYAVSVILSNTDCNEIKSIIEDRYWEPRKCLPC